MAKKKRSEKNITNGLKRRCIKVKNQNDANQHGFLKMIQITIPKPTIVSYGG